MHHIEHFSHPKENVGVCVPPERGGLPTVGERGIAIVCHTVSSDSVGRYCLDAVGADSKFTTGIPAFSARAHRDITIVKKLYRAVQQHIAVSEDLRAFYSIPPMAINQRQVRLVV